MQIVDRATFLKLPAGTVYSKYQPCVFDAPEIKDESCGDIDWFEVCGITSPDFEGSRSSEDWFDIVQDIENGQPSPRLRFDVVCRDGLFDDDQLFAIWEREDVEGLVARFQQALADGYTSKDNRHAD